MKTATGIKIGAIALLVIIVTVLIIQNLTPAPLSFLFWSAPSVPVIVIILVTLVIGYLLGLLTYRLIFNRKPKEEEETAAAKTAVKKKESDSPIDDWDVEHTSEKAPAKSGKKSGKK
ncbi:MAG: hypothetical protein A2Y33_14275 [Spirochaetes bacterium GWF1_51_8]|nr:MAG: hypothetical protein A2Y33_14275 [Spirochaetes bacterium GWF1_51_8]